MKQPTIVVVVVLVVVVVVVVVVVDEREGRLEVIPQLIEKHPVNRMQKATLFKLAFDVMDQPPLIDQLLHEFREGLR